MMFLEISFRSMFEGIAGCVYSKEKIVEDCEKSVFHSYTMIL